MEETVKKAYKIGLIGGTGLLGQLILKEILHLESKEAIKLVHVVSQKTPEVEVEGRKIKLMAADHLTAENLQEADVWIDVSTVPGVISRASMHALARIPLIIGVTGLNNQALLELKTIYDEAGFPYLFAPNFALSIAYLTKAFQFFASYFKEQYDLAIHETHHALKKDSPSGTALHLSQALGGVPITSKREGAGLAFHTLEALCSDEKITITHQVLDRKLYVQGALAAAQYLLNQSARMSGYQMEDLLGNGII